MPKKGSSSQGGGSSKGKGGKGKGGFVVDFLALQTRRLGRAELEALVQKSVKEHQPITRSDVEALLPERLLHSQVEKVCVCTNQSAELGLLSQLPASIIIAILLQLRLDKRLTATTAVCKGLRAFQRDKELFERLEFISPAWLNGRKLIRLVEACSNITQVKHFVVHGEYREFEWKKVLLPLKGLESFSITSRKALPGHAMKDLQNVCAASLRSLVLPSGTSDQAIMSLLRHTPELRSLELEVRLSDDTAATMKDALCEARQMGQPLLQSLSIVGEYHSDGVMLQAFAAFGRLFPELRVIKISHFDSHGHGMLYPASLLRGKASIPTGTSVGLRFHPLPCLESLKIGRIGPWTYKQASDEISTENFGWFMKRLGASIQGITEIDIDTGYDQDAKHGPVPRYPALSGVLARCKPFVNLEKLTLKRIVIDEGDFAPPFSAPKLFSVSFINGGPNCIKAAQSFIDNEWETFAPTNRRAVATTCNCAELDRYGGGRGNAECHHEGFESPESAAAKQKREKYEAWALAKSKTKQARQAESIKSYFSPSQDSPKPPDKRNHDKGDTESDDDDTELD